MAMPKFEKPVDNNPNEKKVPNGDKPIGNIINIIPSEKAIPLLDLRSTQERKADEAVARSNARRGKVIEGLIVRHPIQSKIENKSATPRVIKQRPVNKQRVPLPNEVIEYDDQGKPISYSKNSYFKPLIKKRRLPKKSIKTPSRPKGNKGKMYSIPDNKKTEAGKIYLEREVLTEKDIEYRKKREAELAKIEADRKERVQKAWEANIAEIKARPPEDLPIEEEDEPFEVNTDFGGIRQPEVIEPEEVKPEVELPIDISEPGPPEGKYDYEEVLTIGNPNSTESDPHGFTKDQYQEAIYNKEQQKAKEQIYNPLPPEVVPEVIPFVKSTESESEDMPEVEVLKSEINEPPVGEKAKESAWKKFKESSVEGVKNKWDYSRERLLGFMSFGGVELFRAEGFRRGTGKVAEGVRKDINSIEREQNLTYDDQHEEANRMNRLYNETNFEVGLPDNRQEFYTNLSRLVSAEKINHNKEIEKQMIEDSLNTLKTKFSKKTDYRGKAILSDEKLATIEAELRKVAADARFMQTDRDILGYEQLVRKHLDPEWWKRYVWAGIEAAVDTAAIAILVTSAPSIGTWWGGRTVKSAVGKGVGHIVEEHKEEVINKVTKGGWKVADWFKPKFPTSPISFESASGAPESAELHKNVWNTVKEYLVRNGVEKPTDAQILEVSKGVVQENGVGVKEWGIEGKIADTKMRPGMPISMKSAGAWLLKKGFMAGGKAVVKTILEN